MKHYLRFLMALVMVLIARGGVINAQKLEYDFSDGLPTEWIKSGTTSNTSYGSTSKKCIQLQANATITSPKLNEIYNHIKLNIARSNGGTDLTIKYTVGETSGTIATINNNNISKNTWKEFEYDLPEEAQNKECIITITSVKSSYYISSITLTGNTTDTRKEATLSFDTETITKTIGDADFTYTATLSPSIEGAEITYSSDNKDVAQVDATSGTVTLGNTKGTAIITATYKGNDEYKGSNASYTINLIKPQVVVDGFFDFENPTLYGKKESTSSSNAGDLTEGESIKAGNVTLTSTKKGSTVTRFWNDGLRVYNGAVFTLSVPTGYIITNIALSPANNNIQIGTLNQQNVTVSYGGSSTLKLKSMTITYYKALTTAASSFATYAADDDIDYSAVGLTAYAIELNETEGKVAYNEISETVKAGTPVLVKGEASTSYAMIPSTNETTDVTTALKISDGTVTAADNLYYGFATIEGVSGFKLIQDGVTIPAKKGYLKLTNAMSNAKTFYAFDSEATGIEDTFTKTDAEKSFAPMFNISGQRVGDSYKGIVIVNGKKYVK